MCVEIGYAPKVATEFGGHHSTIYPSAAATIHMALGWSGS
jgi:hypothetical protein